MPKKVRFEDEVRQGLCRRSKLQSPSFPRLDSNKPWLDIQRQYRFLTSTLRVAYSSDCQHEGTKIIRTLRSAREICVTEIASILRESGIPSTSIFQEVPAPLAIQSGASPPAKQSPSSPTKQSDPVFPSPPSKQSDPSCQSDPVSSSHPSKQRNHACLSPPRESNAVPPYPPAKQIKATPTAPMKQSMAVPPSLPDDSPSREVQIYHRLCSGGDNLLRFPISSKPFELFLPRELLRPATKPRMTDMTLVYPPLEVWPVMASNGAYVTIEDVLFVINKRGNAFPSNTLFNGLRPAYGGEYFLVLLSDS